MTDLELAAVTREHFSSPNGYQPPADVLAAQKAKGDLIDRTKYAGYTRDDRRLLARYEKVISAHHADLVAKHFPTAPPAYLTDTEHTHE